MAKKENDKPALRELGKILSPAYPCCHFDKGKACHGEMRWNPGEGHVPRGFQGACGTIAEVEVVLVLAEPANPAKLGPNDSRFSGGSVSEISQYACRKLSDQYFKKNLARILNLCWPGSLYEEQKKKVWITNSVLCSASSPGADVSKPVSRACGQTYLLPQLELFPHALVVTLGRKAKKRLNALGWKDCPSPRNKGEFLHALAITRPGCNRKEAAHSWQRIAEELRRRRKANSRR